MIHYSAASSYALRRLNPERLAIPQLLTKVQKTLTYNLSIAIYQRTSASPSHRIIVPRSCPELLNFKMDFHEMSSQGNIHNYRFTRDVFFPGAFEPYKNFITSALEQEYTLDQILGILQNQNNFSPG